MMKSLLFTREFSEFSTEYAAEDIGGLLHGTCVAFLVIETLFIFLMFASRFLSQDRKGNSWMTTLMTVGYLICIGKIVVGILMVQKGGAGQHLSTLDQDTVTMMLKLTTALQIICPLTTSVTKLGICCLFLQILGRTSKRYRIIIKSTFAVVLVILIVQVIIPLANCKPFSRNWNIKGPGSCAIPGLDLWRYLSIPNVVTTVFVIGLPVPALYRLQVSSSVKWGLGAVFGVCALGIAATILRFRAFLLVKDFHDITYENIEPLCWTIAEAGIYFVAGVMLTLKPLVKRVCGSLRLDSWRKRNSRIGWEKPLPAAPRKEVSRDSYASTEKEYFRGRLSGRSSCEDAGDTKHGQPAT